MRNIRLKQVAFSVLVILWATLSLNCSSTPPMDYIGYVEVADCNVISGWAADRSRLNTSINVGIYDGGTLLTTVPANQLRKDVGTHLKDNGLHGFNVSPPTALKNGATHNLTVRFETSSTNMVNAAHSLTCSTTADYVGYVLAADCNAISGWVADRRRLNTAINVSLYDGGTLLTTVPANQLRKDVGDYLKDNGLHGFNIPTPAALKNGAAHFLSIRFETDSTNLVNGAHELTCSSATP